VLVALRSSCCKLLLHRRRLQGEASADTHVELAATATFRPDPLCTCCPLIHFCLQAAPFPRPAGTLPCTQLALLSLTRGAGAAYDCCCSHGAAPPPPPPPPLGLAAALLVPAPLTRLLLAPLAPTSQAPLGAPEVPAAMHQQGLEFSSGQDVTSGASIPPQAR
jgi:hypothetical protein